MKKKPAAIFFAKNVFKFNFRKFVNGKAVEKTFRQPLQKIWCLLHTDFVYSKTSKISNSEFFAIN